MVSTSPISKTAHRVENVGKPTAQAERKQSASGYVQSIMVGMPSKAAIGQERKRVFSRRESRRDVSNLIIKLLHNQPAKTVQSVVIFPQAESTHALTWTNSLLRCRLLNLDCSPNTKSGN